MNADVFGRIVKMTSQTEDDRVVWKRVNPSTFEWTRRVERGSQSDFGSSHTEIVFTVQRTEGLFVGSRGHEIRVRFTMFDSEEKELLIDIESQKEEDRTHRNALERLHAAATEQHERRGISYFDKALDD